MLFFFLDVDHGHEDFNEISGVEHLQQVSGEESGMAIHKRKKKKKKHERSE